MAALQLFFSELAITITDPAVWLAIFFALVLGAPCLGFGVLVARSVGLLRPSAPAGGDHRRGPFDRTDGRRRLVGGDLVRRT